MKETDKIAELFANTLKNHEIKVNPDLWTSVSSQITAAPVGGSVGISVIGKWIIAAGIVGFGTVTTLILTSSTEQERPVLEEHVNAEIREKKALNQITVDQREKENSVNQSTEIVTLDLSEENERFDEEFDSATRLSDSYMIGEQPFYEEEEIEFYYPEEVVNPVENEIVGFDTKGKEQRENETILVIPDPVKLELPNIFTPNNDGNNDYMTIKGKDLSDFSLIILDLQNRIVYKTNDPEFNWDGMDLNSTPVPNGRYVYYITATDKNGSPVNAYQMLEIRR